jgi:hypothetical protein
MFASRSVAPAHLAPHRAPRQPPQMTVATSGAGAAAAA